jgi:uncharacterized membrane-anchored protein
MSRARSGAIDLATGGIMNIARTFSVITSACLAGLLVALPVAVQAQTQAPEDPVFKKIQALDWKHAPAKGDIAGRATIGLEGGLGFLDATNTTEFLVLQGNLPPKDMFTVAAQDLTWFSVFKFLDEGYVQDDEKIDADGILATLKENNAAGAQERKKRGLPGLHLEGWFMPPRYDSVTKRIEWATLLRTDSGVKTVNFSTKILGRSGHMDVILVSDPKSLEADLAEFKKVLKGFDYVAGERYSEWKQGDKLAAYGLGALVLGGAAAVATKKGFWAVLAAFFAATWKLIAGVAVAAFAGLGAFFKKKK